VEISYTPEQEAFRGEARAWLEANVPDPAGMDPMDTPTGVEQHRRWEKKLADARWAVVNWPTEYGGRGSSVFEWLIFEEEYYRVMAPRRVSQSGIFLLAPTMLEYGTDEQKARFLPRMASGDDIWCQGWSEPEAGSDLAGIRSYATRSDANDGWRLSGQKIWCSRGAVSDWCFGIFRTDPEEERHRGLTYFLVPLDDPGVTVRPIPEIDGEPGFAEIFFDDVFVADDLVLGGVGNGWRVAMSTAGSERGLTLRSPARFTVAADRLVELYADRLGAEETSVQEVAVGAADSVAKAYIDARAYELGAYWTASRVVANQSIGAEASCNKVFWSELDIALNEAGLELLGPAAEFAERVGTAPGIDGEPENHEWMKGFIFALPGPIYGGTNEIQRNIIAERLLGLPRG
jgi:alkylation response protein AidB-like acyl-CoA dehydrogenase